MEFQDKMLKCVDCGADFVLRPGSSCFSTISNSATNPSDARPARRSGWRFSEPPTPALDIMVRREPRPELCARNAAKKLRCPSGQRRDVRCFAGNVSSRGGRRLRRKCEELGRSLEILSAVSSG